MLILTITQHALPRLPRPSKGAVLIMVVGHFSKRRLGFCLSLGEVTYELWSRRRRFWLAFAILLGCRAFTVLRRRGSLNFGGFSSVTTGTFGCGGVNLLVFNICIDMLCSRR